MLNSIAKKSGKDLIIEVLSRKHPLSAMQLHNTLKKEYGKRMTYQATYKNINELVSERIVSKENNLYKLDLNWILREKNHFEILLKQYYKLKKRDAKLFSSKDISIYEFDNLVESDLFWCDILVKGASEMKKPVTTWQGPYAWWIFGNLENEDTTINNLTKYKTISYLKITKDTIFEKVAMNYYLSKKCICKIIPEENKTQFLGTAGPYVLKLSISESLANELEKCYAVKSVKDLNIPKFIKLINGKNKIILEITKNQFIADIISKKIISDLT